MAGYALPIMGGWLGEFQKQTIAPFGAIGALGTPARIALGVGAATVAGVALMGAKQYLSQQQTQAQNLSATTKSGGYVIYAQRGSNVKFEGTTTGSATAATQTATAKQDQAATQSQPDYMQWLLIGGIAIAAIYFLTKKKRG